MTDRELDKWIAENVMGRKLGSTEFLNGPIGCWRDSDSGGVKYICAEWKPTTDLNHCARAEKRIIGGLKLSTHYADAMESMLKALAVEQDGREPSFWNITNIGYLTATARQRCESMKRCIEASTQKG